MIVPYLGGEEQNFEEPSALPRRTSRLGKKYSRWGAELTVQQQCRNRRSYQKPRFEDVSKRADA